MADEAENDRGFEVVDKRRINNPGAGGPTPPDDDDVLTPEDIEELGGEFNPAAMLGAMSVTSILGTSVSLLSELAVVHMGLMPNPANGKIEPNLAEARRAIDVVQDLVRHLEPHVGPADQRQLQNMLSDLRLNFVAQSNRHGQG